MLLLPEKPWYAEANSHRAVTASFIAIAIIAAADSVLLPYVALEFLYLVPLAVSAAFLSVAQVVVVSAICAAFAHGFSNPLEGGASIVRTVVIFIAYTFVALLVRRLTLYGRFVAQKNRQLESDLAEVHASERELESIMNACAIGAITVSAEGNIVRSNLAAHDILGVGYGGLTGRSIAEFSIQSFGNKLSDSPRVFTCRTAAGETFEARIWSSAMSADSGQVTAVFIERIGGTVSSINRLSSGHASR